MIEMFYILIEVVVTWPYTIVKTSWADYLRSMHFTVFIIPEFKKNILANEVIQT